MSNLKKAAYLINKEITDFDILTHQILNNQYPTNDLDVRNCRYCGTLIKKCDNGIKILGWQKNLMNLQNMDLSFPSIITLEIDDDYVIRSIELHDSFRGSMGLICQRQYLDDNLRLNYLNKKIDERFFRKIQPGLIHCFRLVEVMASILSCFQIFQEKNLEYLYNEEVFDAYPDENDLILIGSQRMSFNNDDISYVMAFENGMDTFLIKEGGAIFAENPFQAKLYVNEKKIFDKEFNAMDEDLLNSSIKTLSFEGLNEIKTIFTQDLSNSFMCSNLFPSTFISLFIEAVLIKSCNNNYNLVQKYNRGRRRFRNIPRCIGAIESLEDNKQYFPRYNLNPVHLKASLDIVGQSLLQA